MITIQIGPAHLDDLITFRTNRRNEYSMLWNIKEYKVDSWQGVFICSITLYSGATYKYYNQLVTVIEDSE